MTTTKNSDVIRGILGPLYTLTGMRSSQSFAVTVIGAITKTLEQNYKFLKYVKVNQAGYFENEEIDISPEIDNVDPDRIGKAIETIVRIVYMDLKSKAGLFFIGELKKRAGENVIIELKKRGVDLDLLQIEQRHVQRRQERNKSREVTKKIREDESMLRYTWNNVASWEYNEDDNVCILYQDDGKELDRLELNLIIQKHVDKLTEEEIVESPTYYAEEELVVTEKEIELLKLLHSRDIDVETAVHLLHISESELKTMIHKLIDFEMLHYVSDDVVELSEIGINYLMTNEEEKN